MNNQSLSSYMAYSSSRIAERLVGAPRFGERGTAGVEVGIDSFPRRVRGVLGTFRSRSTSSSARLSMRRPTSGDDESSSVQEVLLLSLARGGVIISAMSSTRTLGECGKFCVSEVKSPESSRRIGTGDLRESSSSSIVQCLANGGR